MLRRRLQWTHLLLTLVVWVCTLPLLLAIALFFLGWQVSLYLAGLLLVALLFICLGLCWEPTTKKASKADDHR